MIEIIAKSLLGSLFIGWSVIVLMLALNKLSGNKKRNKLF